MKRIALTLAAFALTGALAFADDAAPVAKIGGYVNAGIKLVNTSDGTTYSSYASDFGGSPSSGYVGKLTGSITGSNYGVKDTIDIKQVGGVTTDTAYAWLSPVDGFKLVAGSGNDNPFGEVDNNGAGSFSTAGVTAEYTMGPIGAGVVLSAAPGGWNTVPVTAGFRYTLDKVAIVNATLGTESTAGKFDWVRVTASLSAIENLNASIGYNATTMSTTTSNMIDVEVGYKLTDAFKADVIVWSYSGGATAPATTLQYKPNISYTLGGGLTASAYLQGDVNTVASNYEVQGELDYTVGGGTIRNTVVYDTAPNHLSSDKAKTTLESDFLFSF